MEPLPLSSNGQSWSPGDNDGIFLAPTTSELLPQVLSVINPQSCATDLLSAPGVVTSQQVSYSCFGPYFTLMRCD